MSKYIELKNKQRLAKALAEIGMTPDDAKQWLSEATEQPACPVNAKSKSKASSKSCFIDNNLSEQLDFAFWFKEHADAYAEPQTDKKCTTTCKSSTPVYPNKASKSNKSNVTFVPGDSQNTSALYVDGVKVQGDFKACYTYDSTSGKAVLQVEFIDLL